MNLREVILDILLEWEEGQTYSHILLQRVLQKYDYLEGREKAFIKRVTQGTIERKIQIDYILNLFSGVPVRKMKKVIRNLLRSSVYQLLFLDGVPDSAVVNEAVKLANKRKFGSLKGYVNGVLRQIARAKDSLEWPDAKKEPVKYLSVCYSMPEYLVEQFLKWYGDETESILAAFLESKAVTIRFSGRLRTKEIGDLEQTWRESGVVVLEHPYDAKARTLEKIDGVASLAGFREGAFVVQDTSSMMVCRCAGLLPGMTVIDLCAAPGGKTMHAADLVGETGSVKAFDVSWQKVSKIEENLERMGYRNVTLEESDGTCFRAELVESADVVIADVPCSGLGVIGRKQDIKYRIDENALQEIVTLQKAILTNAWQYVKKGGVLMYSTCTMNPEENEQMVTWLEEQFDLQREDITEFLPVPLQPSVVNGTLQMKPGIHDCDGFFVARLRRM